MPLTGPIIREKATTTNAQHLKIRLSMEHTGFTFEQKPERAIQLLQYHSGGKISQALKMAFQITT